MLSDRYTVFDVELFMAAVLLVIVTIIYIRHAHRTYSSRLFLMLCWSTVLVLVVEAVTWLVDGIPGGQYRAPAYLSNFLLYIFLPLPLVAWLCYIDYQLNDSIERLRKRWFYLQPFILSTAVMIYSAFTDFVFSIDANNFYQREAGMGFTVVLQTGMVIFSFILVFSNKKKANRKVFGTAVIFGTAPILGMVLQLFAYGAILILPLVAVAVVFVYVYLETQKEIRDYLTGLLNRQQFEELLQVRIRDYKKKGGFAVLMLDLNDFKEINDKYGHKEGDRALKTVAELLTGSVKNIDKVARFGGDEFIILAESDKGEEVGRIISRIKRVLAKDNNISDRPYTLSLSAGYSLYLPDRHSSMIHLIHQADQNMYDEKFNKNGNN